MKFTVTALAFSLALLSGPVAAATASDRCLEVRAGIDIGSGTSKIQVAEVNTCTRTLGKVLYQDQQPVAFGDDLTRSADGTLSADIQAKGQAVLKSMIAAAKPFHPKRISGVATAVFRNAPNGALVINQFSQQTGASLRVISQQQEGELGFLSARAALNQPGLSNEDLLVWDIGGSSMQMTTWDQQRGVSRVNSYLGKLASVSLKNMIISVLMNKPLSAQASPNPIGDYQDQVLRLVRFYAANDVSAQIKQAASHKTVLGIGGVHGFSVRDQLGAGAGEYSVQDLARVAAERVKLSDSQLSGDYKATDVSNLLLVEGYMQALGIEKVKIVKASLVQGVLLQ